MRFRAALLLALFIAAPAAAQTVVWTPRDDLNATLPTSIRVYEGRDEAWPLDAWYVRFDLDGAEAEGWTMRAVVSDDDDGLEPVPSFVQEADGLLGINAGYFGGGVSYSFVAEDGEVRTHNLGALSRSAGTFYPTRGTFGLLEDGRLDVAWIYNVNGTVYAYPAPSPNTQSTPQPQPSASFPDGGAPWPIDTGVGGGPVIVEDGARRITWEEEVFFDSGIGSVSTRQPRTAVGYTADGDVLLLVADGRSTRSAGASLTELADLMIGLGAVEAVNLDGGGSSTLVVGEEVVNRPSDGYARAVASALVLGPPPGDAGGGGLAEAVFDTGDGCCYREMGDWFETANDGYYGTTRSRLNETGTGADRAVFRFDGIEAGRYEVAAWWVPSFNRAVDAPFTVYQDGAGTTVRADQTVPGTLGQWNALGTFDLAPGDSVVVTDDATGTTSPAYVVADAVRLTLLSRVGTEADGVPGTAAGLSVFPNPARSHATLAFTLRRPGPVAGVIVDVLGREVHRFAAAGAAGEQRLLVTLPPLAPGLYGVRLDTPDGVLRRALTIR